MAEDKPRDPYDAYYFAHCCGRPYKRDEEWLRFFEIIAQRMISYLQPDSVLDAGCAMGFLVEAFRDHGVDAYGLDISEYALEQVREDIRPFCKKGSITDPLKSHYSLICCIEVVEHLSPNDALDAISNLCEHCDHLLFSSTPFDFSEPTHQNVQPPEYWSEIFAAHSFYRDLDFDASFISPWAVLYRKRKPSLGKLIKGYEREFWSLWKENVDLRALTMEHQDQIIRLERQREAFQDEFLKLSGVDASKVDEDRYLEEVTRWMVDSDRDRQEAENKSTKLASTLGQLEQELAELKTTFDESARKRSEDAEQIVQLEEELRSKDLELSALRLQVYEKDRIFHDLQRELEQWESRWNDLEQGLGWRLLHALRLIRLKLIPHGTNRERLFYRLAHGSRQDKGKADTDSARAMYPTYVPQGLQTVARKTRLAVDPVRDWTEVEHHTASVDIIICVHNAFSDVCACLESVMRRTMPPYRLILVDDGSDQRTREYLKQFAETQNAHLIRNDQARGYTRAANQGLEESSGDYVVLLNSDTIVTSDWLDRLIKCAKSDAQIGIVGPLSNTASWQSIPELFTDQGDWAKNVVPPGMNVEDIASHVAKNSACVYPIISFLNGFCLLLKRELIKDVGYFDEGAFGDGYGEENDYCMRAHIAGWKLAVADDTYVFHAQSRSYSHARRQELTQRSNAILAEKYDQDLITKRVSICRDDRVLQGVRARSKIMLERSEFAMEGLSRWEGRRISFLLPIIEPGGGGHVIMQEAYAMQAMGVDVRLINLANNRELFEQAHPNLELPVFFINTPNDLFNAGLRADAVVATVYSTVPWLEKLSHSHPDIIPAYYVQDFEPEFFGTDSEAFQQATRSYTLVPDIVRITKTAWNQSILKNRVGVGSVVVGPSVDIDLYRPRKRKDFDWPERPLRLCAMIRPSTSRRQPGFTMDVLRRIKEEHGETIEIIIFGCSSTDPNFLSLNPDFPHRHAGIISRQQLASLFNDIDVFIDLSRYQAMGLSALEAMACGVAVLVPERGGADSFVIPRHNALQVDTSSEQMIIEALDELILNEPLRRAIQDHAIFDACEYYPEKAAFRFLEALFE